MNDGLIPRRYAKALYKYAHEQGVAERVYALMQSLSGSFTAEPGLAKAVINPFVASADKTKLMITASGSTEQDTVFTDFVKLLIVNNRIDMMQSVALSYLEMYRKANNIYRVEITSASELAEKEMSRLKAIINSHVGDASVEYEVSVDEELIGGFVVKIDSERLDASIKNELKQLRLKLLSK